MFILDLDQNPDFSFSAKYQRCPQFQLRAVQFEIQWGIHQIKNT